VLRVGRFRSTKQKSDNILIHYRLFIILHTFYSCRPEDSATGMTIMYILHNVIQYTVLYRLYSYRKITISYKSSCIVISKYNVNGNKVFWLTFGWRQFDVSKIERTLSSDDLVDDYSERIDVTFLRTFWRWIFDP